MNTIETAKIISKYIDSVCKNLEGVSSFDEFQKNELLVDSCTLKLLLIGDNLTSRKVVHLENEITDIPWKKLNSLSNLLPINKDTSLKVWDTITNEFFNINNKLQSILATK